jgi:polyisoprenoid-binding protein YceI
MGEKMTHHRKLLGIFVTGALLLPAGLAPLASAVAADHPVSSAAPALPPPGTYKIDPDHSFAFFSAWHHIVGRVRGRFEKVNGTITVSQDPAACAVDVTIDPSSISTQIAERDEDLRGPAYFDVKKFPAMTYQGRGIRRVSGGSWTMDGSLTMHGVTKVVPLTFLFTGSFSDVKPGGPARVAFHGTAATKRTDFGLGARDNLGELGLSPVGPDVEIEIDVEADAISPAQ